MEKENTYEYKFDTVKPVPMLMYGKEASNRKQ